MISDRMARIYHHVMMRAWLALGDVLYARVVVPLWSRASGHDHWDYWSRG